MQLHHFPSTSIPIPSPESLFIYKDNEANDHYFQHLCDWVKGWLISVSYIYIKKEGDTAYTFKIQIDRLGFQYY